MLARAAHIVATGEVSRETLRREFYRCGRERAAKGDPPARWRAARGRLLEPSHRARNRESENAHTSNPGKSRPKGSHIIFYTVFFSLMLGCTVAAAQDTNKQSALPGNSPTQVLRLTLDQAVGLALKQNTTAQIAILQAAESEQDRKIALSRLLPQAQVGATEQWERINIRAQFGGEAVFAGVPKHVGP